jgi:hypothetical protein
MSGVSVFLYLMGSMAVQHIGVGIQHPDPALRIGKPVEIVALDGRAMGHDKQSSHALIVNKLETVLLR